MAYPNTRGAKLAILLTLLGGCAAPALAGPSAPPLIGGILPSTPTGPATAPQGTVGAYSGNLSPLYGRINPFYGDVGASYGRINPFYGRINPFYGRINPFWSNPTGFWGQINPFTPTTNAADLAFYGPSKTDAFWGSNNPYLNTSLNYAAQGPFWASTFATWTGVLAQWNAATTPADATAVANAIQTSIVAPAATFWAPLMAKGKPGTATASLINGDLAAAGVAFNADGTLNTASLLASTPSQRAMLFLNLYDDLMDYAGTAHVDWWMGAVGWSPQLAQVQGSKAKATLTSTVGATATNSQTPTIGMIDFVVSNGKNVSKQVTQYGSTVFSDGHGAAVASLIIGAVDGSNVQGVMPLGTASVVVYDPYDDSGTTNWTDVGTGVKTLANQIFKSSPMGVLNASLGVPGWTLHPGWNDALANAGAHGHDLVIAAGNDGVQQTQNVPWNFANNPTILIVGSVGADGTISNFSNQPGEACLLRSGSSVCQEADKLKYRFVVAPGELILVSDGLGGHMRQSGTSLAAPLVTGAIGLLQNRWPWLANYPDETASIILRSATPKGTNPGADPVYGVGELNIAASQAPLNWGALTYYQGSKGLLSTPLKLAQVVTQIQGGTQSAWDSSGLFFSAMETIGNTYRDFQIPLSAKLVGQSVNTNAGTQAYQSFLASALRAQAGRFSGFAAPPPVLGSVVSGFAQANGAVTRYGDTSVRFSVSQADVGSAFSLRRQRYETDAEVSTPNQSFQFGFGNGAAVLDGGAGFVFRSDYDVNRGGANPLLGLASGGAYLGARTRLAPGLVVGIGMTDRSQARNLAAFGLQRGQIGDWVDRYAARAQTVNLAYTPDRRLTVRLGMTHLDERAALLGIQSLDASDLAGGTGSTAASVGADLALGRTWLLSGTGTVARSRATGGQITTRNLTSMSAEVGLVKSRLLDRRDELRLSLASPLHAVGGNLVYTSYGVVDRQTGALGPIAQGFSPRTRTPYAAQATYGRALAGTRGEFSLFGRVDRSNQLVLGQDVAAYSGGAQLRYAF